MRVVISFLIWNATLVNFVSRWLCESVGSQCVRKSLMYIFLHDSEMLQKHFFSIDFCIIVPVICEDRCHCLILTLDNLIGISNVPHSFLM